MEAEDDLLDVVEPLEPEVDEIDEILAALRAMAEKTANPVVRVCLLETYDDIAHLTDRAPLPTEPEAQDEAA
jgi:hypothetical protein